MFDPFIVRDRGPEPGGTPEDASTLGVKLFLISLGMLFAASMVGYVVTRVKSTQAWEGYETPGLRIGLVASTLLLVGCSVALHSGIKAARRGDSGHLHRMLMLTWVFALAFLGNQSVNWVQLFAHQKGMPKGDLSVFLFFLLTALHAAHVLGGFVPLAFCTVQSARRAYGPSRLRGLGNCALYWHFLDAVWVVIAIALFIG
jgi:cytochrome c oxidase subunit 3